MCGAKNWNAIFLGKEKADAEHKENTAKRLVEQKTPKYPHHPLLPVLCTNAIQALWRHKA